MDTKKIIEEGGSYCKIKCYDCGFMQLLRLRDLAAVSTICKQKIDDKKWYSCMCCDEPNHRRRKVYFEGKRLPGP